MSYTDVFGGATLYPSGQSYLAISFGADIDLVWPIEQQIGGSLIVASIMDLTATAGSLNVDMPDARQASNGVQSVFTNVGANTFSVRDNIGGAIISVAPGEAWVVYLTDNSTQAGVWRSFQLGATVSVANAAALAGAGLKAISTTLNQKIEFNTSGVTPFTAVTADRAKVLNYTGGVGVLDLPDPATVGADWFILFRNSGSGDIVATPAAGNIDGSSTITFSPGESATITCDGANYFTVGFGQASSSTFDFISIAVPGSGTFTLSGAQLNRISYRFTGILTGNRTIVVPNTIQQYWVDNSTTGAFTLAVGTAAQVGPPVVPQGDRAILYCDATDVVNATTSSITFPITISQGGTGATTVGGAQTNLQVPPTSRQIIAGAGLNGGGDFSADRTLNLDFPETVVVKGGDTSRSSTTTPTIDPDLQITLDATSRYLVEFFVVTSEPGGTLTPDWKGQIVYAGTYVADASSWVFIGGGGGAAVASAPNTAVAYTNNSANYQVAQISSAFTLMWFRGIIETTSSDVLSLFWSQLTSNASAVTVYAGSSIKVTKLA